MKIEIFDQEGKLVDTIPGSKHRGLNRASWSMRHKSLRRLLPRRRRLNGAQRGPRVLPGRLHRQDDQRRSKCTREQLKVVMDPRANYTMEDRKAQFDSLDEDLQHAGAYDVERGGDRRRARRAPTRVPSNCRRRIHCAKQLQQLAGDCDELRSKIVATKEGGVITGEERIRELIGELYGNVSGYDGRPTDYQVARTESLGHELQDVIDGFQKLTEKDLPGINSSLKKKKMETITVLREEDWQKKKSASGEAAGAAMQEADESTREMD